MNKSFTIGDYLEVDTNTNVKYEGYFHNQNTEGTKLTLYDVVQFPKRDLHDLYHFSMADIKQIKKVEKDHQYEKISSLSLNEDNNDMSKSINASSNMFIFINQVDNKYMEAMNDLMSSEFIAVGTDGAEMGRKCKLSILTLSSPTNIYIFDIQVMQESAIKDGVRDVLQNANVTKIIHNSRKLSDCLYHKHSVEIRNVFDTQAADVLLHQRKNGLYPKEVAKLSDCLNIYLGCGNYKITEKIDIVELAKRPVLASVKESISNNIYYLHQLHKALTEEIMKPFIKGFDFYVNCQRQCSDSEAWYLCSQDKKIPKNFSETIQSM